MKFAIAVGLLACIGAGQTCAQDAIKPGLWEARQVSMTVDGKDMLPQFKQARESALQAAKGMPPEQRARLEQLYGPQSADPLTRRVCVSAAMAANAQSLAPRPLRARCDAPKVARSGNRTTFDLTCEREGHPIAAKGEMVVDGNKIHASIRTGSEDDKGVRQTTESLTEMTFIGADCGAVKPLDEIAKAAGTRPQQAPQNAK